MSTEQQLNVRENSPLTLQQIKRTEEIESISNSISNESKLEQIPSEAKEVSNLRTDGPLSKNDKESDDGKELPGSLNPSKPKIVKAIIKNEHPPGSLSPLSKKLRRDSLRTQLKRACTLALTEQPKSSPTIKTRGRRHSTGTSKESTKKPVIKKNLRKTLGSNALKRKREDSTDEPRNKDLKSVEDIENVKDSKFRRKSIESSLSEPIKLEISVKTEKELDSPIKIDVNKRDSNASNSPVRARRSTRLSPETIPKAIISAKRRGRPAKTLNVDSTTTDSLNKVQVEPKESDNNKSTGKLT